ncbi:MAG: transposase, partial [Candidatus Atribacteria bacterium]|nr:transposase [Candidatus Atribacteria bacterium]
MSKKEARKVTIIEEVLAGRFKNKQAAELLELSVRQVQRLKAEATTNGVMSILHKNRGRTPANALATELTEAICRIYQTELPGYNFCHTTDVLAEDKDIFVSVSTVSRYLKKNGIRSPKAKRRPKKHRSRDAREREGEMAQMDASSFDWLGNGSYLHLHGAVDDASGRILALHFEKEETFEGYCELMFQMNQDGHLPREIYTDGRTVFVYNSKKKKVLTIEEELLGK